MRNRKNASRARVEEVVSESPWPPFKDGSGSSFHSESHPRGMPLNAGICRLETGVVAAAPGAAAAGASWQEALMAVGLASRGGSSQGWSARVQSSRNCRESNGARRNTHPTAMRQKPARMCTELCIKGT